jgi:signal transduction histidine kinase
MISHEFRTPLNGLLRVSDIILNDMSDDQRAELKQMYGEARERILAILEDALLIAEIDNREEFSRTTISLTAVLAKAMEEAAGHFVSRKLSFDAEGVDLGTIVGYEPVLIRALRRLIETAVKLCGKGQYIQILRERRGEHPRIILESQDAAFRRRRPSDSLKCSRSAKLSLPATISVWHPQ